MLLSSCAHSRAPRAHPRSRYTGTVGLVVPLGLGLVLLELGLDVPLGLDLVMVLLQLGLILPPLWSTRSTAVPIREECRKDDNHWVRTLPDPLRRNCRRDAVRPG